LPVKLIPALVQELASRQSEPLRRFLRARVRNSADIPDIIQEAFLRLLRVPNVDTIRAPDAYIFTIAWHVARQHELRSAATPTVELEHVLNELFAATDSDPELQLDAQECVRKLDAALRELPVKIRFAFLFYRCDGLSMDEISQRLGISRATAKKYLAYALAHLRKRLRDME